MYGSIADILCQAQREGKRFCHIIMEDDARRRCITEDESRQHMRYMLQSMREADAAYDGKIRSTSGMSGGDGLLLEEYNRAGKNICGEFIGKVMEKAIKMAESNACMKRIVAAPTAGSCGVIPAVLLTYELFYNVSDDDLIDALYVAAGIGKVIGDNASISGAFGGCQAEIGSASAMASGALVHLQSGDNEKISHGMSLALKNMLGLACDPVGGLVEIPCVKRNSIGAVNAVTSAQLALAGIKSFISPDDVIDSMRRIGNEMPESLKETAKGGLAVTASAMKDKPQ